MCLHYEPNTTERLRRDWRKSGRKTRVYWKVTRKKPADPKYYVGGLPLRLQSQHWHTTWRVGVFKSSRKSKRITAQERRWTRINYGVHVYLQKPKRRSSWGRNIKVVPVVCHIDDLIAAGREPLSLQMTQGAVFTKVTLRRKDYNKAMGIKDKA